MKHKAERKLQINHVYHPSEKWLLAVNEALAEAAAAAAAAAAPDAQHQSSAQAQAMRLADNLLPDWAAAVSGSFPGAGLIPAQPLPQSSAPGNAWPCLSIPNHVS